MARTLTWKRRLTRLKRAIMKANGVTKMTNSQLALFIGCSTASLMGWMSKSKRRTPGAEFQARIAELESKYLNQES